MQEVPKGARVNVQSTRRYFLEILTMSRTAGFFFSFPHRHNVVSSLPSATLQLCMPDRDYKKERGGRELRIPASLIFLRWCTVQACKCPRWIMSNLEPVDKEIPVAGRLKTRYIFDSLTSGPRERGQLMRLGWIGPETIIFQGTTRPPRPSRRPETCRVFVLSFIDLVTRLKSGGCSLTSHRDQTTEAVNPVNLASSSWKQQTINPPCCVNTRDQDGRVQRGQCR